MSRSLRIEFAGAFHHVMNRGYHRMNIFRVDEDFRFFISCLEEVFKSHTMVIHAYCLMDNHFHLFTETPNANLSKAMQRLQSRYAHYFKLKYKHEGKVFWKRYKAILVDTSTYGVDLTRYIHCNPLGHQIDNLEDFKYSSYRSYLNIDKAPIFLDTNLILKRFDSNRPIAIRKLKEHTFLEGASYWLPEDFIVGKSIMGNENFIERVKEYLPETINEELAGLIVFKKEDRIPAIKKIISKLTVDLKLQKNLLIYALRKKTDLGIKEIAWMIGEELSKSALSNRIKRLKIQAQKDLSLAKILIDIDSRI